MNKKIQFVEKTSDEIFSQLNSACVISSTSAWSQFTTLYSNCPTPSNLIIDPSVQLEEIKMMASSMKEHLVVGIGGGRVMDATKALAKLTKAACILIPSILSTTAWLNSTSSLKKGVEVHHTRGKYDQIIIDCNLIAAAPSHLNFGGLMDLLVGYSGLADWKLKKRIKGGYFPKMAENVILSYCDRIRSFMENASKLSPTQIPQMASFYVEGIANCYGLLSGQPLDAGEHLLYYALEEQFDRPMNHGAVISLCTLICLRLHGSNSYISVQTLKDLMDTCNIGYTLSQLNFPIDQFMSILKDMKQFVELKKYPFSIWNTDYALDTSLIEDLK